jgi:prepilin-type N-terminal cleavage/methylation domain-containing protein
MGKTLRKLPSLVLAPASHPPRSWLRSHSSAVLARVADTASHPPRSKMREAGFTLVELMMSLAVLAIGLAGIIAMQKVTVSTNLHAKSLATATRIAQAWQDQLMTESSLWNRENNLLYTPWLGLASSTDPQWTRPAWSGTIAAGNAYVQPFGAGFDALGNPVFDENIAQAQFCVHFRLQPVYPLNSGLGVVRITVRVLWPRVTGSFALPHFCDPDSDVDAIGAQIQNFHVIYQTSAVRIHR